MEISVFLAKSHCFLFQLSLAHAALLGLSPSSNLEAETKVRNLLGRLRPGGSNSIRTMSHYPMLHHVFDSLIVSGEPVPNAPEVRTVDIRTFQYW